MHRKQRTSEVKTDVRVLLDCLKCQLDNPDAVKQAFRTLAAIFTNVSGDEIKDYFRSLGGLEFIVSYNKTVTNVEVVEAALFCLGCAVENNVYSQKELTTSSQFTTLHRILSDDRSTTRLKHSASYLLLTLVSNNSVGQSLAKQTLCLSDLLGLLRTSLPSVCSKDHWFDDAGTTGFEVWSSAITALCMCLNNPQNEENQRVCGFVLPYVFTVLQQSEEEKVIKPLLSLIRFSVANNETNQTHVKSCGGLTVLSEKLQKSTQQPKDTVSIPLINTIDACIADHGENAEVIGNLETVKVMMKLLSTENITQGERLQIIVTLVHAVEMADKNKEDILDESGLYALMKSLNDIESGDDELFRAIKYLIQLCTNPDAQEPISESTEMLDILKKTEAMHRNSGMLLLNKINKLSERLETFEEVSARGYHQLTSSNSYMSDTQNLRPRLIEYNCEIPTQIPINHMIGEQQNRYLLRTSTPSSECRLMKEWKDYLLQENVHSDKPYQSIPTVMMPLKQNMQQPHLNSFQGNLSASNSYHLPDKNLRDHFQNQDKNLSCPGKSQTRIKDLNGNLNIKSQYRNEVELSRLNPSILSDLYIPPSDYTRYLVDDGNVNVDDLKDINDKGQSNNNDNVTKFCKNQCFYNLNEKGDSNLRNEYVTDIPHPVKNLTEVFDYDHQRYVVSKFSCNKDISENGIKSGGQVDNSFCSRSHADSSLDMLDGQMYISECFQGQQTSCDHFQHHSGSIQQKCHCNLEHEQCANFEMSTKQKIDDMPLLSENREKPDRKKLGELNYDTDEQTIVECQQSDESRSMFLTGTESKKGNARKSKKYEVRLVESESKNDSHLKKACTISKLSLNDKQTSSTNQSLVSNKLQTSTDVVEQTCNSLISDTTKHREISVHVPPDKCGLGYKDQSSNGKNVSNNSSLNLENEEQGQDSDDKFVKPVGRPLKKKKLSSLRSSVRSSVRRAHPFWKQQLTSDTDTDYDSSGNESVFDEKLITTAKKYIPNSPQQSNTEYLCFTPDYFKATQGNLQNGRCHDVLNSSHSRIPYSSSSSVCSSPGSVSSYMSSSSDKLPQKNNRCPGCIPSIPGLKLNSRTFNIVLETHPFTCQYHRTIREVERRFIKSIPRKSCTKKRRTFLPYLSEDAKEERGLSVYEMSTDSEHEEISPPCTPGNENITASQMEQLPTPMRRKRVFFSEEETQNLLHGVEKFGKSWSLILQNFKFHTTRTAVDLKDKHRGIQNKSRNASSKQKQRCKPFSMCEDRRLFRGIKLHGYNWKTILGTFRFSKERTSEDLRNRWRTLHKKNCIV